ncbi:MAG: hypoxanthine phosphoribosyltransferase [Ruminococcaceae bacterium]|nr:hypoxanthine phosphoribosyltransferase [Oscillospiraceae bacterium]
MSLKHAKEDIEYILINEQEIENKVKEIAQALDAYYKDEEVIAVCILKGSVPFYWDLVRKLSFPVKFDFMCVSSYGSGTVSTGEIKILKDLVVDIKGKNVLIVEDILDSGNTLYSLKKIFEKRNPKDVKICTLLDKPERRVKDIKADFCGFEIEDKFVVGYGLDYDEKYRQLPYIGVLKESVYTK